MDDLSPRARALLAAAVGSDDPIASDASRVRRGVLLRIGSAGVGATVFSLCLRRSQAFVSFVAPKLVTVALVAIGGSALNQQVKRSAALVLSTTSVSDVHGARQLAVRPTLPSVPQAAPVAAAEFSAPPKPTKQPLRYLAAAPEAVHRASDLEAEMRWVRTADAALRNGDASGARGLLEQHAREFPNGMLSEEREALRVVAVCRSAPSVDSRRAAARFLERAPHSLLAGRVRSTCASPTTTSGN